MKVLLVEDNAADARLMLEILKESPVGTLQFQHETRLDSALERLRQESFDVVLLDLGLSDSQGMETLTRTQKASGGLPIVVLTGLDDERFALKAVRAGAQDYLVKGRFGGQLLVRTIRYAIERKRAEEASSRLAAIVESSDDAILSKTLDGTILTWNQGAERLYGYTAAEAIGQSIMLVVPTERQNEFKESLQCIASGERIEHHETVRVRKDGSRVDVSVTLSPVKNSLGEVTGVSSIARNISARKRVEKEVHRLNEELERRVADRTALLQTAIDELRKEIVERTRMEEALRESEEKSQDRAERVQAILDTAPAIIWITEGADAHAITGNRFAREFLRLPQGVDMSRTGPQAENLAHYRVLEKGRELDPKQMLLQVVAATGKELRDYSFEVAFTSKVIHLSGNITPVFDKEGRPNGSIGVFIDVTRHREAERALLRSEKLASVGRMAATIAHEINNPLEAMTNTLFLANGVMDLPEEARQYLEVADTELKRVAHITRQSLGFYRESNAPVLTSIHAVLESAVDLLKSKIRAKGLANECVM